MVDSAGAMAFKDVLDLCFKQADVVRWYWNLYFTVVVGLVGLLAGVKVHAVAERLRSVLVVGFLLFAGGNLTAIDGTQQDRLALKTLAITVAASPQERAVAERLSIPGRNAYVPFHLAMDLAAAVAIVLLVGKKAAQQGDDKVRAG
jgi:hypothetical protein